MPNSFPILVGGASAVARSTAKLMKTGQTTSYRTGDDGDIEAGREVDFFTLAENNPFGNTNRFTDELGGQTYTNNWVIDWSTYDGLTVLGYYRVVQAVAVWNDAIDGALGTFGTFAGCYLPNRKEVENIINISLTSVFNYSPLNISSQLYTSTTYAALASFAWSIATLGAYSANSKTNALTWIPVRNFTVTGTTLT